jgi:hypothetical protein
MVLIPIVSDELNLPLDPIHFITVVPARRLQSEAPGILDLANAGENIIEIRAAKSEGFGRDSTIRIAQAILDMNAPNSFAIGRKLFPDDIAEA